MRRISFLIKYVFCVVKSVLVRYFQLSMSGDFLDYIF